MDSSQSTSPNDQPVGGDVVSKVSPTAEVARSGEPAPDADSGPESPSEHIGMAQERRDIPIKLPPVTPFLRVARHSAKPEEADSVGPKRDPVRSPHQDREASDLSAGSPPRKPRIHVSRRSLGSNDQSADGLVSVGRRRFRSFVRFLLTALIAALIGVAASSAWHSHGDKAMRLTSASLGWLSSEWQSRSPAKADSGHAGQIPAQDAAPRQSAPVNEKAASAAIAISPELVEQLKAMARDLTNMQQKIELLAAVQEQMTQSFASLQAVEQRTKQKMPPPPPSSAVSLPPRKNPQRVRSPQAAARASIVADWWIRESRDGYVYVQGHGTVYQAALGAPLPGLGPIKQIERQDGRWLVVTPKGIIVSKRHRRYFEQH